MALLLVAAMQLSTGRPDRINDAEFNAISWEMLKGSPPMPVRPHAPLP